MYVDGPNRPFWRFIESNHKLVASRDDALQIARGSGGHGAGRSTRTSAADTTVSGEVTSSTRRSATCV